MPRASHSAVPRARVLTAHRAGDDWMLVVDHNGIPPTTARRIIESGRAELLPRGGARESFTKCTPEIEAALEAYNCTYTLATMKDMVMFDFGVDLSTSTISNKLNGKLYMLKQVRVEPQTCNNEVNKAKRIQFAKDLRKHMSNGDFIVYYDETNYNVHCKRSQGRAKKGERATVVLPPSKGANLQIKCAVSTEMGLVHHRLERGSIRMNGNAAFVDEIYAKVKAFPTFIEHFQGKKVVVVLDNAPAHSQTEDRVMEHDDLVLLRLAPYSRSKVNYGRTYPVLYAMPTNINACVGYFSVLKAKIKSDLALARDELVAARPRGQPAAARMAILERAARRNIVCMDTRLVKRMALRWQHAVAAAERLEDMKYGA